jgi:hypothetical protein
VSLIGDPYPLSALFNRNMTSRRVITDYEAYGKEKMEYLLELKASIVTNIDDLSDAIKEVEETHGKYMDLIDHLLLNKKDDLCEHYAKLSFAMLMVLHDGSQKMHNGRLQFPHQVAYELCNDRRGDFSWNNMPDCPLDTECVEGLKYRAKEIKDKMRKHDVSVFN